MIAGSLMSRSQVSDHVLLYLAENWIAKPTTMVIASNRTLLTQAATNIFYYILLRFLGSDFSGHAQTIKVLKKLVSAKRAIIPLKSFGELTRWYNQIANLPIAFLREGSLSKHMASCIFTERSGGNMPNKWPVITNLDKRFPPPSENIHPAPHAVLGDGIYISRSRMSRCWSYLTFRG